MPLILARPQKRPLENALPALVAASALSTLLSTKFRQKLLSSKLIKLASIFNYGAAVCVVAAAKLEPLRWQQFPSIFACIIMFFQHFRSKSTLISRGYAALYTLFAAILDYSLCKHFPISAICFSNKSPRETHFSVGTFDYAVKNTQIESKENLHGTNEHNNVKSKYITIGRCFYPSPPRTVNQEYDDNDPQQTPFLYRKSLPYLLASYINFGVPSWLQNKFPLTKIFQHWKYFTIPAQEHARLAQHDSNGKMLCFPVVVISHGLKSSREMHSALALELASLGNVVFCMEHLDGSAAVARFPDGTTNELESKCAGYHHNQMKKLNNPISEKLYTSKRMQQCRLRCQDIDTTMKLIKRLHGENKEEFSRKFEIEVHDATSKKSKTSLHTNELLSQFNEKLDCSKMVLAGHSFGGSTVLTYLALEHNLKLNKNHHNDDESNTDFDSKPAFSTFSATILLDPAMCWIPQE